MVFYSVMSYLHLLPGDVKHLLMGYVGIENSYTARAKSISNISRRTDLVLTRLMQVGAYCMFLGCITRIKIFLILGALPWLLSPFHPVFQVIFYSMDRYYKYKARTYNISIFIKTSSLEIYG